MVLPRLPRVICVQLLRLCGARPEGSVVNLPLVVGEQSVGMLALWGEGIGEADVAACALFVSQLSSSMEKASLLDETRRRATFLEAVTRIAAALTRRQYRLRDARYRAGATGRDSRSARSLCGEARPRLGRDLV